jgi:hypothetical protein
MCVHLCLAQTLGIANSRTVERDASVAEVARLNALLTAAQARSVWCLFSRQKD